MLIIGDAVINNIDPNFPVKRLEIIANHSDIPYIKTYLGLRGYGKPLSDISSRFYKGTKEVVIHNASAQDTLHDLLLYTASNNKTFKHIPSRLQFAIQRIPIVYNHINMVKWCHDVKGYNILRKHCTNELIDRKDGIEEDLAIVSKNLVKWKLELGDIKYKSPVPNWGYIKSHYQLMNIIKSGDNSEYNYVWEITFYNIIDDNFLQLDFVDKLRAVTDRLYIDTLTKYIIGHPDHIKLDKYKVKMFFMNAFMNLVSNYNKHPLFCKFMIENYKNIKQYYTGNFYTLYKTHVRKEKNRTQGEL